MITNVLQLTFKNSRKSWSIIILIVFSIFSYTNIFQQTDIRNNLPEINLVQVLNSHDRMLANPTPEKTDLYLSVSKMFENFRTDYLKHYENYALVLKSALILEESKVSFRFYPSKHYLSDGDRDKAYKLGNLAVDFSKNFNLKVKSQRESLLDCSTPTWFSFSSHREGTEKFVNSYIYPLFESQERDNYADVPKEIEKVIRLWILLKYLQISNFICSLLFLCEAILVFSLHTLDSKYYYKLKFLSLAILFKLICTYSANVILTFLSLIITIIMSNSKLNEKADYNASHNFGQIIWLLVIGYFTKNWIYELYSENHSEEEGYFPNNDLKFLKPLGNHTLKKQFQSILKKTNNDEKINDNSHNTEEISIIAENDTSIPPNPSNSSKKIESEENENIELTEESTVNKNMNNSSVKVSNAYNAAHLEPNSAMSSESLLNSKDPFINCKPINMVSSINSTPFELSSSTSGKSSPSSPVKNHSFIGKNEISLKPAIDRNAFYEHSGISVNYLPPYNTYLNYSNTTIPNGTVSVSSRPTSSETKPDNLNCEEENTTGNSMESPTHKRSAETESNTENLQNINTTANSPSLVYRNNKILPPTIIISLNENENNTEKVSKSDLAIISVQNISNGSNCNE